MMNLCDSHSHVLDEAFDSDRDEVIQKAFSAGVKNIVEIACAPEDWQGAVELCGKYPGAVFCACGIHPEHAGSLNAESAAALEKYLGLPAVKALGEAGLDYVWLNFSRYALSLKNPSAL